MSLPPKPTTIPSNQVLQYVVKEDSPGDFKLKTDATLSGVAEVDIDAQAGDNIALADATTGVKATVTADKELKVVDTKVQDVLEQILAKLSLKPVVDFDNVSSVLSPDTVETYTWTKGVSTILTMVVTYDDNTRQRWNNIAVS